MGSIFVQSSKKSKKFGLPYFHLPQANANVTYKQMYNQILFGMTVSNACFE